MGGNRCENCQEALTGPYCAACGQHAHASARSLGGLIHDVWHDLTHIEGRLWITLQHLLMHPGRLTVEYFQGRRARYVAPFRLYLVMSVICFALSSVLNHVDGASGTLAEHSNSVQVHSEASKCRDVQIDSPVAMRFVQQLCNKIEPDDGRSLIHTFAGYVPKALFVFLPLVAGILALLYRRQGRYFVEHLVFVLHNHAAAFSVIVLVQNLHLLATFSGAAGLTTLQTGLNGLRDSLADIAVLVYLLWYTYRSLRRFYGLPRGATAARMVPLGLAYFLFLALTFAGTFLLTVWTS